VCGRSEAPSPLTFVFGMSQKLWTPENNVVKRIVLSMTKLFPFQLLEFSRVTQLTETDLPYAVVILNAVKA
jgi:hypothetical protein